MKIKKAAAVFLAFTLLFSVSTGASYAETSFTDIKGHWSESIVQEAAGLGIISGYTDGTFKPDNLMKREEFYKLVANVLTSVPDTTKTTLNYSDVDPIEWYIPTMKIAVESGIASGYGDGKLGIGMMVSRQEAAKIVASIIPDSTTSSAAGVSSVKDSSEIASWAYPYVDKMFKKGYLQGEGGYFRPTTALTRAEAATLLLKVKKNEPVIVGSKGNTTIPQQTTSSAVQTNKGLTGAGSKNDPYIIATADDLNKVKDYTTKSAFFILKNDITITSDLATGTEFDLESKNNWSDGNFTPIGSKVKPFVGYFDGKGHTITGLVIKGQSRIAGNVSMANYAGLFGYLGKDSVIENITVKDSVITGKSNTGAIVGFNEGSIENCVVEKDVEVKGDNQTGGIVGSSDGILKKNVNKGDVTGNGTYTGGIAGFANNDGDALSDCSNRGTVTGVENTGGIAGAITSSSNATTVKGCTNSGEVISETANAGGITGIVNSSDITIENCSNSGDITSKTTGGIAGYNKGKIISCFNTGAIKGFNCAGGITAAQSEKNSKVFKCYNSGEVNSYNNAGGIVGSNDSKVSHSYNTGEISGSTATGGITGQNTSMIWNTYNVGKVKGSTGVGALAGRNSGSIERSFWLDGSCDADTGLNDSGSLKTAVKKLSTDELSGKTNTKVMNEDDSIITILNKDEDTIIWKFSQGDSYLYPQLTM